MEHIKGEKNIEDAYSRIKVNFVKKDDDKDHLSTESKREVLKEYHNLLGLPSTNTMKFLILKKYHWEKINKDIEELV